MLFTTLNCCLFYSACLPVELRRLISAFSYEELTDDNIHNAVLVTLRDGNFHHGPMEYWDTSQITNMSLLFYKDYRSPNKEYYEHFNTDISRWNVSNVTEMRVMFGFALFFNQPIVNWDVSQVKDMVGMFYCAASFNQPIGKWKVREPKMTYMFESATSFNQPLTNWVFPMDIHKGYIFFGATSFNQELPPHLTDMDNFYFWQNKKKRKYQSLEE